mmetsp:Transcript_65582/g.77659  ORF Transcript_65582/g.77659 Transcript_65582/m.77659 type:complete len:230 (-) Transcript_65582:121-810(-)
MYLIRPDRMPVQIPYTFHRINLTIQLHLITLHNLLNCLTDVTKPHVNPRRLYPSICRLLHRLQQRIVTRIKTHSPRRINNPSVNLRPKIHLHHVVVLQNRVVTRIRSVMRRDVVQAATRRKPNTAREPVLFHQFPILILQHFAHVRKLYPRFYKALRVFAYRAMDFGRVPDAVVHVRLHAVAGAFFGGGFAVGVAFERMGGYFAHGEGTGGVELREGDCGGVGLAREEV